MVFNATSNNISTEHIKIMVKRFTDFAHNVPISIKIHIEKENKKKPNDMWYTYMGILNELVTTGNW